MVQYIAERIERGTSPSKGWYYWLTRRYTNEAVNDFLQQWHLSSCDLDMVRKVQGALGMQKLPEHVAKFGRFMLWRAGKAITPADVIKAYTITLSSIQREERTAEVLRSTWPDHPFTGKVRPEDAWAYLLHETPEGQRYVKAATERTFDAEAARVLARKFSPFSRSWRMKDEVPGDLYRRLLDAVHLAQKTEQIQKLLRTGEKREWTKFVVDTVRGVSYAKAGFLASLLGRGDLPTADAREHDVWAPGLNVGKGNLSDEYLAYLDERLRALNVDVPPELRPFYQHLVHHAVWDKTANSETTHREIVKCMAADALADEIKEFTGAMFGEVILKPVCRRRPDPHQLAIGRKIEMEHTDDPEVAETIARGHICEIPDYYDPWLLDMERKAKAHWRRRRR
jgi:hypothetical protein